MRSSCGGRSDVTLSFRDVTICHRVPQVARRTNRVSKIQWEVISHVGGALVRYLTTLFQQLRL